MYDALVSWGINPNPYDSYVVNKMVDRKQCTICWQVEDLKILHMSPKVVDGVLSKLTTNYRKVSPLSISRGQVHDQLSMRIDYITKGKVWITMTNHSKGIMELLAEDMNGISKTPAANHLFTVQ